MSDTNNDESTRNNENDSVNYIPQRPRIKYQKTYMCLSSVLHHWHSRRLRCQERLNYEIAKWRCYIFTDDGRFILYESDWRLLVWRESKEQYIEENRGGSVCEWIMRNGKINFIMLIEQSLNRDRCPDLCELHYGRRYCSSTRELELSKTSWETFYWADKMAY